MVCEDAVPDFMAAPCAPMATSVAPGSLDDMLDELDASFSETLLKLIDRTGKKDSEIYQKGQRGSQAVLQDPQQPALQAI